MKRLLKYLVLILIIFTFSCDEPAPTEIYIPEVPSNAQVDIEVLSPEPDLYVYQNGYDSIGYVAPTPSNKAIINLSGITNTYKNITVKRTSAFALFVDKSKKVLTPNGRLIGYNSKYIGKVNFNDINALSLPYRVKYRWLGNVVDTTLGWVHYFAQKNGQSLLFPFPYNSSIKFKLDPIIGNDIVFDIPTPYEIIGYVRTRGKPEDDNFEISLHWNSMNERDIAIVVGGMNSTDVSPFPLYKIRVKDTGEISIPKSLLKTFPYGRFNQLVISFVRQKFAVNLSTTDQVVVAQSIHNIKIDVP
ncbi:MAG: hypothetical protein ABFS12_02735 [Bacteroidota bacterium]